MSSRTTSVRAEGGQQYITWLITAWPLCRGQELQLRHVDMNMPVRSGPLGNYICFRLRWDEIPVTTRPCGCAPKHGDTHTLPLSCNFRKVFPSIYQLDLGRMAHMLRKGQDNMHRLRACLHKAWRHCPEPGDMPQCWPKLHDGNCKVLTFLNVNPEHTNQHCGNTIKLELRGGAAVARHDLATD